MGRVRFSVSRILYLYCLLTTAFLLIMMLIVYEVFVTNTRDSAREYVLRGFSGMSARLQRQVQEIKEDVMNIAESEEVTAFLQDTPAGRYTKVDGIRKTLATVTKFRTQALELCLIRPDAATMQAGTTNDIGIFMASRRMIADYQLYTPFRNVLMSSEYEILGRADRVFAIAAPVYANHGNKTASTFLGAVTAVCSVRELFRDEFADGLPLWVSDGSEVLTTSDPRISGAWHASAGPQIRIGGRPYSVISSAVAGTPWTLYAAFSEEELLRGVGAVRSLGMVIGGVTVLAMVLLTAAMKRRILGPIINIAQQTEDIGTLSGQVKNPAESCNELVQLTEGINSMLSRLEQMNREVAESEQTLYRVSLANLKERIMLLQTQINPHFLYNSLECIRGMAAEGRIGAVREMCSLVASMYRYCIKGGHTVTFADELESVHRFFDIVTLRYGGRYTLSVSVSEESLACLMPRMVLQPLVENAVLHGFARANRQLGNVCLKGEMRAGTLHVRVEDDGGGMPPGEIDALNETLRGLSERGPSDTAVRIGIQNVASRTLLIFGKDSRVLFEAREGSGLCAKLTIAQRPPNCSEESKP